MITKLEIQQDSLIRKLNKRLTKQERKDLSTIIDLEYKLTMIQEGHEEL